MDVKPSSQQEFILEIFKEHVQKLIAYKTKINTKIKMKVEKKM